MSMNTGAIYAKLKADLSNFKQGMNDAKTSVNDLSKTGSRGFDGMNAAQRRVQEQINRVTRSLELAKTKQDTFNDSTSQIKKMGVANQIENYKDKISNLSAKMDGLGKATKKTAFYMQPGYMQTHVLANMMGNVLADAIQNATQKLQQFVAEASNVATEYEKAMTTLEVVAPRFNVPVEKAKATAESLGKELRIGVAPAAEGLQNLLKSGLNLDQASDLMERFTNEAKTGKSANISLADAVTNLSFAYTTGNSALGNMSGISENFSDIQERGLKILQSQGKLLGKTVGTLDDAGKKQAQYAGMIELTNLTLGSSEKFLGSFGDNNDRIAYAVGQVQLKIGQLINKALRPLQKLLLNVLEPLSQNEGLMEAMGVALGGIAVAITALVIPALKAMLAPALAAMAPFLPFALLIGAIGAAAAAMYYAWNTNMGGIRDAVKEVWTQLSDMFLPTVKELKTNFDNLKTSIDPLVSTLGVSMKTASEGLGESFKELWESAKPFVQGVADTSLYLVKDDFNGLKQVITEVQTKFNEFLVWFQSAFAPEIQTFNVILGVFKSVWDSLVFTFQTMVMPALVILGAALMWIGSNVITALMYAWEVLREPVNTFIQAVMQLIGALMEILIPVVGAVIFILSALFGIISTVLMPVFQILWGVVVNVFSAILQIITGVIQIITGVLNVFIGIVKGIFTGDFSQVAEGFKQIWEGVKNFFGGMLDVFIGIAKGIVDGIYNTIKSVNLFQAGVDIINGLINGIKNMAGAVGDEARKIADNVQNTIKGALGIQSPSRVMMQVGVDTVDGLKIGMEDQMPTIETASANLASLVEGSFGLATNTGSSSVDNSQSTFNSNVSINAGNSNPQQIYNMIKKMLANDMQNQKLGFNRTANA